MKKEIVKHFSKHIKYSNRDQIFPGPMGHMKAFVLILQAVESYRRLLCSSQICSLEK